MHHMAGSRRRRAELADAAARWMREHGLHDVRQAVARVATQAGAPREEWPSALEVEAQLRTRMRLFEGGERVTHLKRKRESALAAMQALAGFEPRIAGPVWEGWADAHAAIQLHLYADRPELVAQALIDLNIPYREQFTRLHFDRIRREELPMLSFVAGEDAVELVILPADLRRPPWSPQEDRPMPRGTPAALRRLLDEAPAAS
jgi:hypothetical protein